MKKGIFRAPPARYVSLLDNLCELEGEINEKRD